MENKPVLVIHANDNVAVAIDTLTFGSVQSFGSSTVELLTDIPKGHKFAIRAIKAGEDVIKYGAPIGKASQDISCGSHVHVHNISTKLSGKLAYTYNPEFHSGYGEGFMPKTFKGYRRKDGSVGIRNDIWIIPTVGCVNRVAERLARTAKSELADACDGIHVWTHPYGCSQMGDDQLHTQTILAALVRHPNAGGVLVLGLGCENNHIKSFREILGDTDPDRVKFLESQGVSDEQEAGMSLLREIAAYTKVSKREPIPVSELIVGLKCGGSDGFSGITANPLTGVFSDRLILAGGTSILTEVPEMFGAETFLMNRCINTSIFDETVTLINDFKDYYIRHNQVVYENPSPGNKDGGISTLEEKSLGCIQKGGNSQVVDILFYGAHVTKKGLNIAEGPGNDIVAVTTLAAAGAHLILFTTGRGTPLGGPVPTVKIATNNELAANKPHWIDFNAGRILSEDMSLVADELVQLVCDVASGKQTRNEENDFSEIAIFKDGVTL